MANYSQLGVTIDQMHAARLLAEGQSEEDVILVLFGVAKPKKGRETAEYRKARETLEGWVSMPKFREAYRAIVRDIALPAHAKAIQTIIKQMDSKQEWLANKAANDILTRYNAEIMGEEDKALVIQIQGAPDLGEPDADA